MGNYYDIIIIGTGTGGGTIAHRLADCGKDILILERGGFIPRERQNWDPYEVFSKGRYRAKENWLDGDQTPFQPFIHYNVGGNSKMYGAALFRFREADFGRQQHYGGVSPAWPFSYKTLEPYYQQAEEMYHVHGKAGIDPTEPPRSHPYPYLPLPYEPFVLGLESQLRKIGLHPFPLPMGVILPQDSGANDSPVILENFDGYPDPTSSKTEAQNMGLNPALKQPKVTLMTDAWVQRLGTSLDGKRVEKVEVLLKGEKREFSAGLVILACGAVNSSVLLLKSANSKHPQGLGNSSGMVGRNLMLHHNGCLIALTKKKNTSIFQKSLGLADFYLEGSEGNPLGEIQLMGRNDPDTLLSLAGGLYPGKTYEQLKEMSIDFWLTTEDLPSPENRVTITQNGQIQVNYKRNNYEAYEKLKEKLKTIFKKLGQQDPDFKDVQWVGYDLDISGMSHQNGTLRFGINPSDSVLDIHCKAHDLENLFAVDGSFFPSCGAFNPALTIAANALRVGDHILAEFKWR